MFVQNTWITMKSTYGIEVYNRMVPIEGGVCSIYHSIIGALKNIQIHFNDVTAHQTL